MLSFDDEPERTFDALELRKMAIDCLEIGSVKGMAHKLDRLVNPSGEDLSSLSATNRRRVCRNVFTHGSLVWNCQNCQSDPTCVQCAPCFQRSNHVGHKVFFHKSTNEGCCDCGDLEAWAKEGCCPDHMPLSSPDKDTKDIDILSTLPSKLMQRATIVIYEVIRYVTSVSWDCSISYEATPINLSGMSTGVYDRGGKKRAISMGVVQSPSQRGTITIESAPSPRVLNQDDICVRVHNDDVHTYGEVSRALLQCGSDAPVLQTQQIDQKGESLVASGSKSTCMAVCSALRRAGLLVSTCRAEHIEREDRSNIALGWLVQLSISHDAYSRLVILELLNVRCCSSATSVKRSSVLHIRESGSNLERIHSDYDTFADTTNTPLIVLLATDPLLPKQLRATVHGLYMRLLTDPVFKAEFGFGVSLLYKHLTQLFSRGIGTSADSIFLLTVQIFTTPSLVKSLCDRNGETSSRILPHNDESVKRLLKKKRLWADGGGLLDILFSSLEETLQAARLRGAMGIDATTDFLDGPIIVFKRFSHSFKSCSYVLQTNWVALDMLSGSRTCSPVVLLTWIKTISGLQCIDMNVRYPPNRGVEDSNNDRWLGAFALSLNIGNLSDTMMSSLVPKEGDEDTPEIQLAREEAIGRVLNETASALRNWLDWNISPTQECKVECDPVSLHIPLHRFFSRALAVMCSSQFFSKYHEFDLKAWNIAPKDIMEHPLRALVLSSQISSARLWARYESSVSSAALNYLTPPFCKRMRDLDILLLQVALGSGCISHAEFIIRLLTRFSVVQLLYPYGDGSPVRIPPPSSRVPPPAYLPLLEDFFTLIIQIITETLPLPTKENTRRTIERELAHRLAAGCKVHSRIIEASCPMLDVSEMEVTNVMYDISDVTQGTEGVRLFNLNAASASLYDPTFWHLSVKEHQVAEEKVVEILAPELRNCDEFGRPVVTPPPPPHPLFTYTRSLLDCYVLSTLCNRILFSFVTFSDLKDHATFFNDRNIDESSKATFRSLRLYLEKLQEGMRIDVSSNNIYNHLFLKPSVLLISRVIHILTLQLHCCTSLPFGFKESVIMLRLVSELEPSLGTLYGPGMKWVISEYERRFENSIASSNDECIRPESEYLDDGGEDGSAVAEQVDDTVSSSCITAKVSSSSTSVLDTATGPKASRERMMAFLARQAASFSKLLDEEDLEDDDESIAPASKLSGESKECSPRCIMCHEQSIAEDSLAFVGFAQRSTILSNGIVSNSQHDVLRRQYIVCAPQGCPVRSEFNVNSQKLAILPKGAVCMVLCEVFNGSVHIVSPITGWATILDCLVPLKTFAWSEWGRARPHVSLCGHAIHIKCWDAYYALTSQRCESDVMHRMKMSVNLNRSEFLCPMCKRISNLLVPYIDHSSDDTETQKCKISVDSSSNTVLKWAFAGNVDNDDITSIESADEDRKEDNHPRLTLQQSRESMTTDRTGPLSIIRYALLEGARKKKKCSFADLKRCAEGLFTASTPPWAPKREIREMFGMSLDHIVVLWSSLGYSVASIESSVRASSKVPIEVPDIRPFSHCVSEVFTGFMMQPAADTFITGLADMLEGKNIQQYFPIDPNARVLDSDATIYTLPYPVVWEAEPFNAGDPSKCGFVSKERNIQIADCYGSGFYCCKPNTLVLVKFVPLPLLSWDLLCLSSCVGSIAGPSATRIMCVARLAQALIEPYMCLWGNVATTSGNEESDEDGEGEDIKAEVNALSYLRSKLAESAGLAIHPRAPTGTCLSHSIRKAITPFYRTVVLLTETMCNRAISLSMCHLSVNDCLHTLGLPNLTTLASNPRCIDLCTKWGQQYRHAHNHTETDVVNAAFDSVPLDVRQPSPGNGSINFIGPPLDVGGANVMDIKEDKECCESSDDESDTVEVNINQDDDLIGNSTMFHELVYNLGFRSVESELSNEGSEFQDVSRERSASGRVRASGVELGDNVIAENHDVCCHRHSLIHSRMEIQRVPSLSNLALRKYVAKQIVPAMGNLTGGIKPCRWEMSELFTDSSTEGLSLTLRLCDLSHLGVGSSDRLSLLGLPKSYVELYLMISAVNGTDPSNERENAICLICGEILIVGSDEGFRIGACTLHAWHCGSGCCIFFLVQRCVVLLMRDSFAAYYGSMYVDEYGEEDTWVRRGRPLYLSATRYATLCCLYLTHQVAEEVCRRRSLTNKVIRNGYF